MNPSDDNISSHDGEEPTLQKSEVIVKKTFPTIQVVVLASLCLIVGLLIGAIIAKMPESSVPTDSRLDPIVLPSTPIELPTDTSGYEGYTDSQPVGSLTATFPEGSAYENAYGSVYYKDVDGNITYLTVDLGSLEYINEDFIKDKDTVFYKGLAEQWVNPDECSLQNLSGCQADRSWESLVSPYTLEIGWLGTAIKSGEEIPSFGPLCRSEGYKVGEVKNGFLAGSPLFVQSDEICDMWCGGRAILNAHHYVKYGDYVIPVAKETGFNILNIATSTRTEKVPIPGTSLALISAGTIGLENPEEQSSRSFLFTDTVVGNIYRDDYACFVSKRPDHVEVAYSLELPFDYSRDNGEMTYKKLDGTLSSEVYKAYRDYNSCLNVVEGSKMDESKLIIAGEFSNGVELYEFADSADEKLLELYKDPNTLASYQDGMNKYSYDEFLNYKPYLYWKDPFGDWVEFLNKRFDVAAEKCKPVIYLYPESEGRFTVEVEPNGGFTETIPEYHDGWNVIAKPDSTIVDTRTGETYPYLYWEGINTGIPEISEGWVIEKSQVEFFLKEKLARLGLIASEIDDFNEYWVARLQAEEASKFKIMFVPQVMFDELAPLSVVGDEKPQTVIRVMMYAQPALEGESLPEQILPSTPARRGFTVVEWGGALLN